MLFLYIGIILVLSLLYISYRRTLLLNPKNKIVFISGCDHGFGYLSAVDLSRKGCIVLAGCLTPEGIKKLNSENQPNIIPFQLDITNQSSIDEGVEFIKKQCKDKGLWGIINNAGIVGRTALIDLIDFNVFRDILEVNFFGHVAITKALLPLLKKTKGRIINTASILGRGVAGCGAAPYICSKRAIEAFNDCLRLELQPWGIKVIVIEPGYTNTQIFANAKKNWDDTVKKIPREKKDEYGEIYFEDMSKRVSNLDPTKFGDPKNVADAYSHAVLSQHPKQRYLVGKDAWLIYSWLPLLPSWMSDYITLALSKHPLPSFARKHH